MISFLDTLADSIAYHQKPTPVLQLALIRRNTARSIGKDCYRSAKGFRPTDHLPQQQALEQMADSDTLLLLSEKNWDRYRMAKLYQYLAIGKPIIMFGPAGEISYVVERLGAGRRIAHGGSRELHTFIDEARHQAFMDYRTKAVQWLAARTRASLAEKPFSILTQIEKGVPPTPPNIPMP